MYTNIVYSVYNVSIIYTHTHTRQTKQGLEKAKANLEADREGLASELKDTQTSLAESDKRRRGVEAQLSEAQSHIAEDTARVQELTEQCDRLKVCATRLYCTCVYLLCIVWVLDVIDRKRKWAALVRMYVYMSWNCIAKIIVIACLFIP